MERCLAQHQPTAPRPALQPSTPINAGCNERAAATSFFGPFQSDIAAGETCRQAPVPLGWSSSNSPGLNNVQKMLKTQIQRAAGGIGGRIWVNITCSILAFLKVTLRTPPPSSPQAPGVLHCCQVNVGFGDTLQLSRDTPWLYC